jgi:hypothetical protein
MATGQGTEITFQQIPEGTYTAGVQAVYSSGVSEIIETEFESNCTSYTVTFVVKDVGGQPITDASIVFDGTTLSGYIAENVLPGNHPYSVSKTGYTPISGEVIVVDKDETVTVQLQLGIDDYHFANIQLYPNPFMDEIYLNNPELIKNFQITDIIGQTVKSELFNGISINTENLSSGIYFVTLESFAGEKLIKKVVKK